jgi:hypothetical protein
MFNTLSHNHRLLWVVPKQGVGRQCQPLVQVWHFEIEIPAGMAPGPPQVHSCSALLVMGGINRREVEMGGNF